MVFGLAQATRISNATKNRIDIILVTLISHPICLKLKRVLATAIFPSSSSTPYVFASPLTQLYSIVNELDSHPNTGSTVCQHYQS
jgi:hypothetical protein